MKDPIIARSGFSGIVLFALAAAAGCGDRASAPDNGRDTTGGTSGSGAVTGGTSTGGAGTATGGSAGTSMPTGGVSSGGVATGGTSTGGTATGGTSTGGTTTGGSGGGALGGSAGSSGTAGSSNMGGAPGGAGAGGKANGGTGGRAGGGAGGATAGSGGSNDDLYVSPTGNDSNAGTQAAPFKTLTRAHQAASAGKTIWMLPGTHAWNATVSLTKSGAQGSAIVVSGAAGSRPLIDFAAQTRGADSRGIEISGNYWHFKNLELANAGDNCIAISGSNNTVENVVTHDCEDTGIQITVGSSQAGNAAYGANNLILNCDSYNNFDVATGGENADGFAAKLRIGPGNIFRGCRAWNNADDGWDLFASNDVVVIENSWAFSNGKVDGQNPAGDGNGFKLGGAPNGTDQGGAVHLVRNTAAFENRACGYTRNNNPSVPSASDCKVRDNPSGNYCSMSCSPTSGETMTAAQAKVAPRSADGSLPPIQ
jgi:pectate disaccharide-lyase